MGNFDRGNRGGRPSRGKDFGRPEMHKAICSNCGKECRVPFKPTNGKPIFCSDCFESRSGGRSDSRRPQGRSFERNSYGNNNGNRTYGRDSESRPANNANNAEQYRSQFEALNRKLDKILKMLSDEAILAPVEDVVVAVDEALAPVVKKAKKAASKKKK